MAITRRSILKSLPFLGAAAAAPAVASTDLDKWIADPETAPEHPWVKARRLANELSATMAECKAIDGDNGWAAICEPEGSTNFPVLFESMRHRYRKRLTLTDEQGEAVAAWQLAIILANDAWNRYCAVPFKHRDDRADIYDEWKRLHRIEQDALCSMTRALYPPEELAKVLA